MTVEELLILGKQSLHSDQAKLLLATLLQENPLELLTHLSQEVKEETVLKYQRAIKALREGKPIQYALGTVNFYGLEFQVNESVLIPRFETEELVEHTLFYIKKYLKGPISLIDLGTGSGVIGLTIKSKCPSVSVTLLDISEKALEIAKKNQENLGLDVTIQKGDMLEEVTEKYDVIISNPPYIREDEEIEQIVKENEPSLALYGGKDGLDYYRKIFAKVKQCTKERYLLAFEIGATQAEELTNLVEKMFPEDKIEVKKDLQGRNRMLFVFHHLV